MKLPFIFVSKNFVIYGLIISVGLAITSFVYLKSEKDFASAIERYKTISRKDTEDRAQKVTNALNQVYQGIRTISMLPSVKSIDRHGTNIDVNANESIIQIYNNLRSNVTVSEVYIVPVDIDPEKIDPVTGSLEIPILMYDDGVAAHEQKDAEAEEEKITTITQAEAASEVEIFEYRALKEQMAYFREHYPKQSAEDKLNLPFIGSPSVLTCDNTDFETSHKDPDRNGAMLSVPFYGSLGEIKGSVTAVLRDNVMRLLLPDSNFALVNKEYNYLVMPTVQG
jgi:hypothetical protein